MSNSAKKLTLIPGQSGGASGPEPMDRKPYAPRGLSETASDYWREYTNALQSAGMLFEIDLNVLKDLCRWEAIKERAFNEMPGPDQRLYVEYYNSDTGDMTHVQSHAAFTNLRSIQGTINKLREKLGLSLADRSGLKIPAKPQANNRMKSKSWT